MIPQKNPRNFFPVRIESEEKLKCVTIIDNFYPILKFLKDRSDQLKDIFIRNPNILMK